MMAPTLQVEMEAQAWIEFAPGLDDVFDSEPGNESPATSPPTETAAGEVAATGA